jgi:hypothetical protein
MVNQVFSIIIQYTVGKNFPPYNYAGYALITGLIISTVEQGKGCFWLLSAHSQNVPISGFSPYGHLNEAIVFRRGQVGILQRQRSGKNYASPRKALQRTLLPYGSAWHLVTLLQRQGRELSSHLLRQVHNIHLDKSTKVTRLYIAFFPSATMRFFENTDRKLNTRADYLPPPAETLASLGNTVAQKATLRHWPRMHY